MPSRRVMRWNPVETDAMAFVRAVRAHPPDAIEIDLSRRPAQGRDMAEWLAARKYTRDIPITFLNGEPPLKKVVPPKTTAQKLGLKDGLTIGVVDAPRDYAAIIGVAAEEDPVSPASITVWFMESEEALVAHLRRLCALAAKTKLWIAWRKDPGSRLRGDAVRSLALDAGLVDYKICSLGDRWSGMLFAPRRK